MALMMEEVVEVQSFLTLETSFAACTNQVVLVKAQVIPKVHPLPSTSLGGTFKHLARSHVFDGKLVLSGQMAGQSLERQFTSPRVLTISSTYEVTTSRTGASVGKDEIEAFARHLSIRWSHTKNPVLRIHTNNDAMTKCMRNVTLFVLNDRATLTIRATVTIFAYFGTFQLGQSIEPIMTVLLDTFPTHFQTQTDLYNPLIK